MIKGGNFSNGKHIISVFIDGKLFAEDTIKIENNFFSKKIKLGKPLMNKSPIIEIKIDKNFSQIFKVILYKLYGKVKYFNKSPVKKPIITAGNMCSIGDSLGNYEIILSKKEKSILIFDKNYSKSTLECYLYEVNLAKDTNLNILIDKLEVYELHCWQGVSSTYIHFIPMSVSRINRVDRKIYGNQKLLAKQPDIWPKIEKDEVKVFVNEKEVPILTFCVSQDFLFKENNKSVTRPAYLLSIPKIRSSNQIIKVQIRDSLSVKDKKIIERGEGYYLGFY